jgi:putative addiction module component (TIGR02574 family)
MANRQLPPDFRGSLRSPTSGGIELMQPNDLDISKLSVAERIQLAEDLWDSVADETGGLPLSAAQKAELDRRLADLEASPEAGEPWDVVRSRLEHRLAKGE